MAEKSLVDLRYDARFVAAHYFLLQGLAALPSLAALTVLTAAADHRYLWWSTLLGGLPLAFLVGWGIATRYQRRYGRVRPHPRSGLGFLLGTVAVVVVSGLLHRWQPTTTVSLEGLAFAVGALVTGIWLRPLRVPFVTLGALGAVACLVPLGGDGPHPLTDMTALLVVVYGCWILLALWCDRLLRSVLRNP